MADLLTSKEYTYLFEHISLPEEWLQQWLLIPEFVNEVSELFSNQETVSDSTILPIMESVYSEYDAEILSQGYHINGANFADLQKAIRRLYKVLKAKSKQKKG